MAGFCWIYTTTSTKKEAQKISDHLLARNLISCANIFPGVESRFRWKGKTQISKECAVIFKTKSSYFKKIEKEILKIHSYEVPCIVKINWSATTPKFGRWITTDLSS